MGVANSFVPMKEAFEILMCTCLVVTQRML